MRRFLWRLKLVWKLGPEAWKIFAVVEQSSADITGSYVGARIRIVGNEKFGVVA